MPTVVELELVERSKTAGSSTWAARPTGIRAIAVRVSQCQVYGVRFDKTLHAVTWGDRRMRSSVPA